jgi:hypothetical protein
MATPLPASAAIIPRGNPGAARGVVAVSAEAPAQARSDARLLDLWLFGKGPHTRRAYQRVAGDFLATLGPAGLRGATLGDLQAWMGALPGQASSRAVTLAAVKSLLTFGHRVGYLPLQARQPVGQHARGSPLLRPGQKLAEATAVAEHRVADDDQAPAIPQRLESQSDRAARAWGAHAHSKNQLR